MAANRVKEPPKTGDHPPAAPAQMALKQVVVAAAQQGGGNAQKFRFEQTQTLGEGRSTDVAAQGLNVPDRAGLAVGSRFRLLGQRLREHVPGLSGHQQSENPVGVAPVGSLEQPNFLHTPDGFLQGLGTDDNEISGVQQGLLDVGPQIAAGGQLALVPKDAPDALVAQSRQILGRPVVFQQGLQPLGHGVVQGQMAVGEKGVVTTFLIRAGVQGLCHGDRSFG